MTTTLKKRDFYLIAFLLPVIGMLVMLIVGQTVPFGDSGFAVSDMYSQTLAYLVEFRRKLRAGESLAYSWNLGLGDDFFAIWAYYLSSPENWLVAVCPESCCDVFFEIFVVIKTGLAGLTMAHYLSMRSGQTDTRALMFSVFYGLSAYVTAYYLCNHYLNAVWLAPLIALGIECLVRDGKWKLYVLCLAFCILTNYYIAIPTCMFCVLYFLFQLFTNTSGAKKILGTVMRFAGCSLLAGGLASVMLVPVFFAMSQANAMGFFSFPDTLTQYFSPMLAFCKHALGSYEPRISWNHEPNLYCGVLVFLLLPMYVTHPKIPVKRKIGNVLLLAIFMSAFTLNIPDFLWHGMSIPQCWAARESFLYIFVVVSMCHELACAGRTSARGLLYGGSLAVLWTAMSLYSGWGDWLRPWQVITTLAVITIYVLIYVITGRLSAGGKCSPRLSGIMSAVLVIMALAEVSVHAAVNCPIEPRYRYGRATTMEIDSEISKLGNDAGINPGRVRIYTNDACNELFSHNSGLSALTTCINKRVPALYNNMGMRAYKNEYWAKYITPLEAALLGVDHALLVHDSKPQDSSAQLKMSTEHWDLYEYAGKLPFGWVVSSDMAGELEDDIARRYYTDEELFHLEPSYLHPEEDERKILIRTGVESYDRSLSVTQAMGETLTGRSLYDRQPDEALVRDADDPGLITFSVPESGYYSITVDRSAIGVVKYSENGKERGLSDFARNRLIETGFHEAGDRIQFKHEYILNLAATGYEGDIGLELTVGEKTSEERLSVSVYKLNEAVYSDCLAKLSERPFENVSRGGNTLSGNVTLDADSTLILPVVNSPSWRVILDGQTVEQDEWAGCFIKIPLAAGHHEVEMVYRTRGLITGLAVTLVSAGIVAFMWLLERRRASSMQKRPDSVSDTVETA